MQGPSLVIPEKNMAERTSECSKMIRLKHAILLSCMPILLVVLGWQVRNAQGPYWLAPNQDPEYAYLLNALNIAGLKAPVHIDHPGTTLQILGAVVLRIGNVIIGDSPFARDVLGRPEAYLVSINTTLLTIYFLSLSGLGLLATVSTGRVLAGVLAQAGALVSTTSITALSRVTPEPVLLIADTGLIAMVLLTLRDGAAASRPWIHPLLFAVICGGSLATKVTFLPLLAIPLILLSSWRLRARFLGATILVFLLGTVPIWRHFGRMGEWFFRLFVHTGNYGSGATGIVDPESLWSNLRQIVHAEAGFVVFVGIGVLVWTTGCIFRRGSGNTRARRALAAVLVGSLLQLLLVAKHPGPRYLLPAVALSGLTVWLSLDCLRFLIASPALRRMVMVAVLAILGFVAMASVVDVEHSLARLGNAKREAATMEEARRIQFADCTTIYYNRCSTLAYALRFGDDFAGNQYGCLLATLWPETYFYDIWTRCYSDWHSTLDFQAIRSRDAHVVFQGTPFRGMHERYKPALNLVERIAGEGQSIYSLERR